MPQVRSNNNLQLVTSIYRHAEPRAWQSTLQWLETLEPSIPPHRTSLWRKLDYEAKKPYFAALHHVHDLILKSTPSYNNNAAPSWQASSLPFWKLLLIFDILILHPKDAQSRNSPNDVVKHRLRLFRAGGIQELCEKAQARTPTPAQAKTQTRAEAAQMAADVDNYHTAYARLTSSMPVASITPDVKQLCQKLYPPPTTYVRRHHPQHQYDQTLEIDTPTFLRAIQKLKRGTAAGPYGDLTETLKAYATHQPTDSEEYPYLETFILFLQLILNNQVPAPVAGHFAANYFMALHKDPDDPTKLRPIGMGSAYRRILGKYIMEHFGSQFAAFLLPVGQFGIALKGGLDLILHMTRANIDRYLNRRQHPSRLLLLLDITNMFNSCSRASVRDLLADHPAFQPLLPFFDFLYGGPNKCYFFDNQGNVDHFVQEEGFAQGCPLGPIFSALCFYILLKPLQKELKQRANARKQAGTRDDDGHGSRGATTSYLDDTGCWLAHQDTDFFLARFTALGTPLGIMLNPSKTKILTNTRNIRVTASTSPTAPLLSQTLITLYLLSHPEASPADPNLLAKASAAHEIVTGCRHLGQPIGSKQFANDYLSKAAAKYKTHIHTLQYELQDKHTAFALYNSCALMSLQHLLAADVAYNAPTTPDMAIDHWTSPFLTQITATNNTFFHYLTDNHSLHPTAIRLLHHPTAKGGVGVRDLALAAVPSYIITHTRSIRYATQGIPVGKTTTKLPKHLARSLSSWASSTLPTFHTYRTTLHLLLPTYQELQANAQPPAPTTIDELAAKANIDTLSKRLYQEAATAALEAAVATAPTNITIAFPSILSPLTSIPFASYSRRHKYTRLKPEVFTTLLQRKLRLPALPPDLLTKPCYKCQRPLDPYGDHLYRCDYKKTPLHNQVRDALLVVCKTLATPAGFTYSKHGVRKEPYNLIPQLPNHQPADVYLHLKPSSLSAPPATPVQHLAIDVTITTSPNASEDQPDSIPNTLEKAHLQSIKRKLSGADKASDTVPANVYMRHVIDNEILVLPFSVDPFGGLGPFASQFLHGKQDPPLEADWYNPQAQHTKDTVALLDSAPKGLLPKANKAYAPAAKSPDQQPKCTPTQWALKTLAINTSQAPVAPLHRSTTKAYRSLHDETDTPLTCKYIPFHASPVETHMPFPHFALPVVA